MTGATIGNDKENIAEDSPSRRKKNKNTPSADSAQQIEELTHELEICRSRLKNAEWGLEQLEEHFENIYNNAIFGVFQATLAGQIIHSNNAFAHMFGYDNPQEMISSVHNIAESHFVYPEQQQEMIEKVLKSPEGIQMENLYRRMDGSTFYGNLRVWMVKDRDGNPGYLEGFIEDMTERRKAEEAEQRQRTYANALMDLAAVLNKTLDFEEVLQRLVKSISLVMPNVDINVWILTPEGEIERVLRSERYYQINPTLKERDSLLGLNICSFPESKLYSNQRRAVIISDTQNSLYWQKMTGTEWVRSYVGIPIWGRDGMVGLINLDSDQPNFFNENQASQLEAFANHAAIAIENARLYAAAQQELAERQRAEEAERQQRTLAEALAETAEILNSTLDQKKVLEKILHAVSRVISFYDANLILIDPDTGEILRDQTKHIGPRSAGVVYAIQTGEITRVEQLPNLLKMYRTRQPMVVTDTQKEADWISFPNAEKLLSYAGIPIMSKEKVVGFISLYSLQPNDYDESDIYWMKAFADQAASAVENASLYCSVQKELAERKQMESSLLAAQKMADLGTLAAGVAHELNSPLQVITGISDSLIRQINRDGSVGDERLARDLTTISRNGWRSAEIIRSLLAYARSSSQEMAPCDLNRLVQDVLLLMQHQLESWSNVVVLTHMTRHLPLFYGDYNQMIQVLVNLLANARDAMPGGGRIIIRTEYDLEKRRVCLMVTDTGEGIPEENLMKIFTPFFTTKSIGKGTGLGLALVMSIVQAHHGDILVESRVKQGTTFKILLLPESEVGKSNSAAHGPLGRFEML